MQITNVNFALGGMNLQTWDIPAVPLILSDNYFMYNSLLLSGDGTNNATNATFIDSSTNNFNITRNGNPTQGTFSPYGPNWSNYFDGTSDFLTAPAGSGTLATGNFTVEGWIYCTANPSGFSTIFSNYSASGTTAFAIFSSFNSNNRITLYVGGSTAVVGSTTIAYNSWTHIAAVRNSGVITLYINGVSQGTVSYSESSSGDGIARIGCAGDNPTGTNFQGYISNSRWVIGTAVYTGNFTPSTTPLTAIANTSLLTCQSNRFIDNSTNNFTITRNGDVSVQRFSPFNPSAAYNSSTIGGSGYFDGTGDYLTAPNNAAFNFGTGNFTVECWVYVKSFTGSTNVIISTYQDGSNGWTIGIVNNVFYGSVAGDSVEIYSSVTPQVNTWTHLALTRSSTTLSLFVNGVVAATQSNSTNMSTASALTIGTNVGGGSLNFTGYITDVRVVKGTAVYTSAFTPPTTPLTAVANTSVLTSFTNAGIIDNTMINNLETVGNAQISTTQSKFGGSSMYFDGTGDYLTQPSSQNFNFGTGNFTMEGWFYQTGLSSSYPGIVSNPLSWGNAGAWSVLSSHASGIRKLQFYCYNADTSNPLLLGTTTLSDNTWYYFAVTRSDTTFRLFLDGTIEATATFGGNVNSTSSGLVVGINQTASGYTFQGYIDDLRITKGYARYTTTFTPPTATLETQ